MIALVSAVEAVVEASGGVGGTHAKHNIARVSDIIIVLECLLAQGQARRFCGDAPKDPPIAFAIELDTCILVFYARLVLNTVDGVCTSTSGSNTASVVSILL